MILCTMGRLTTSASHSLTWSASSGTGSRSVRVLHTNGSTWRMPGRVWVNGIRSSRLSRASSKYSA